MKNDACSTTFPHTYAPLNPTTIYCQACGNMLTIPVLTETDLRDTYKGGETYKRPEWVPVEEKYIISLDHGKESLNFYAYPTYKEAKEIWDQYPDKRLGLKYEGIIFEQPANVDKFHRRNR